MIDPNLLIGEPHTSKPPRGVRWATEYSGEFDEMTMPFDERCKSVMTHVTKVLSHFIADLKYENLPEAVVDTTKKYILDYYAACFAGIKINADFNRAMEEIFFESGGKEVSSVLCQDTRLPVGNAAFLNAVYAHGADMDDGNRKAMGHVAAHVMSTVFALAETLDVSGKDIITAINAGYEVYNRTAAAVQPGLVCRGFHSTGTAGALACGAAAAKLLGLDENGIYNAISLAATQSAGLMLVTESGQACKPINPANAARSGILAAQLAQKGILGPFCPLESSKGWFHAMSDAVDEKQVTEGLGTNFTICESYLKPYPACRHTHCGIDAALKIRQQLLEKQNCLDLQNIERIAVYIYPNAIRVAGNIWMPETDEESKFSIHYALSVALLRGYFELEDLNIDHAESELLNLIEKIILIPDESMENTNLGIRGAKVLLEYHDGTVYKACVSIPKGDAGNPFSVKELHEKLAVCADGVITVRQQNRLIASVESFEKIGKYNSINTLFYIGERN